jgi:hypothetical protein
MLHATYKTCGHALVQFDRTMYNRSPESSRNYRQCLVSRSRCLSQSYNDLGNSGT